LGRFPLSVLNPHLTVKTSKKPIDPGTVTPPNPHSPKTPNPPVQTISLSDKKSKKTIDSPISSSGKKVKKPTDDSQLPPTPIDSKPKKLQDSFHQDFPLVPTKRRGANRFKGKSFRRSTRSTSGKSNIKPPSTSDPIQLSSDHESPHKKLKEDSAEESKPDKEIKSELITPSLPQKDIVTPSSQIPTPSSKYDIPSTSTKEPKPSSIEQLQKENAQLLQRLAERETVDRHLHHDNVVLQAKVNYLQWLDQMTTTNHSLRMQLKHRKRPKLKSPGHEGEASKANLPPPSQV
jgi:hypothetical protein